LGLAGGSGTGTSRRRIALAAHRRAGGRAGGLLSRRRCSGAWRGGCLLLLLRGLGWALSCLLCSLLLRVRLRLGLSLSFFFLFSFLFSSSRVFFFSAVESDLIAQECPEEERGGASTQASWRICSASTGYEKLWVENIIR
jgi:hypothetical protein